MILYWSYFLLGVVGSSNKGCYPEASLVQTNVNGTRLISSYGRDIGEPCTDDSQCLYNYCYNSKCASPPKECPTKDIGLTCSGHGSCNYTDIGDNPISTCVETDVNCKVKCDCLNSYGGKDCSYDPSTLKKRADLRITLCGALLNATMMSDPSPTLLVSLADSLKMSYDPFEIHDGPGKVICSQALAKLSELLADGYLETIDTASILSISQTISLFVNRFFPIILSTIVLKLIFNFIFVQDPNCPILM